MERRRWTMSAGRRRHGSGMCGGGLLERKERGIITAAAAAAGTSAVEDKAEGKAEAVGLSEVLHERVMRRASNLILKSRERDRGRWLVVWMESSEQKHVGWNRNTMNKKAG